MLVQFNKKNATMGGCMCERPCQMLHPLTEDKRNYADLDHFISQRLIPSMIFIVLLMLDWYTLGAFVKLLDKKLCLSGCYSHCARHYNLV